MTISSILFEDATIIGVLPSVAPRPNHTNIRALDHDLCEKLQSIPSQQSKAFGYLGMAQYIEEYALNTNKPWVDWDNPGPVRGGTDGTLTSTQQ